MKKLFSALFIAGLLFGTIGCGSGGTTGGSAGGSKDDKIKAAKQKVADAEKALKDAKPDIKAEDKKKLEDDLAAAKKALDEAEKAK